MAAMKNRTALGLNCLLGFLVGISLMGDSALAQGSNPSPSPTPEATTSGSQNQEQVVGDYLLTSSIEVGVRGLKLEGNGVKYRADLNYHAGVRIFDSSFLMRSKDNRGVFFDTLLVNSSGWGGDPNGFFRADVEKTGIYRLNINYRLAKYSNSLSNIALGQHNYNTRHKFGDFDLTLLPQNERIKFYFGYSPDQSSGTGLSTLRFSGDEFPTFANWDTRANNFRAGVDAKVLGFDLSFLQGLRYFKDDSSLVLNSPQPGNNTTNLSQINTHRRELPTTGHHFFTRFSAHTFIKKKLDFAARYVYTSTTTRFNLSEQITGIANTTGNIVVLDRLIDTGVAKRPYGLGDLAATFFVTDKFSISESFRVDNFRINGGDQFSEALFQNNRTTGVPLATVFTNTTGFWTTNYRRYMNTIRGDYEFTPRYSAHVGYRYTNRHIEGIKLDQNLANPPVPRVVEEFDNRADAVIFGLKALPTKIWSLYFDGEHGTTDNVFVRVDNYKYTNLRVRTRVAPSPKLSFNAAVVTKNNSNPTVTEDVPPRNFGVDIKTRIFSGSVSWAPNARFSLDSGYTYSRVTSDAAIIMFITSVRRNGVSQYFMRDHSVFVDAFVQIHPRVTAFASYRIGKDNGQGNLVSTDPTFLIDGYPYQFQSPEVRLAFKISNRVDWNVGYQYYNYKEKFASVQNYRAHLPYTSLRLYFGRKE
jgi:hypothetical protein